MGCLFCNIINGTIPSKKIYEDDMVFAFEDISPQSPVHILVVPKTHVQDIEESVGKDISILADVFHGVTKVVEIKGLKEKGYRVIINNGKAAGQVIWHLHVHVMGGKDNLGPMLHK